MKCGKCVEFHIFCKTDECGSCYWRNIVRRKSGKICSKFKEIEQKNKNSEGMDNEFNK